ncbi:hypothetical protein L484_020583 [Morus notabilis]|uniref:Uncharacterized protein n=1 Tax=Morus notabilis TaxID=981085 RepID=W9SBE3_9ROSA|nr:uncharacterized protein LOC21403476 [Morus notabilis]EXC20362.1 hypothetical protein L484_020583 [Morus notabilis]
METAPPWEDDYWELCNDDGFVYKRRKRRSLNDPPLPRAQTGPDPEADELNRRDRKRKALSKLKARYQTEIAQWEYLSNTLCAMEDTTRHLQLQRGRTASSEMSPPVEALPGMEEPACGLLLDDLLLQVEAQEAIIINACNLCDIAEAMCNAHEEEANQSLIELPIWALPASPRELLASLCDQ